MNNDYRLKHKRVFHDAILKAHKVVRWRKADAPKNPFEAAIAACSSKIVRIEVPPVESLSPIASSSCTAESVEHESESTSVNIDRDNLTVPNSRETSEVHMVHDSSTQSQCMESSLSPTTSDITYSIDKDQLKSVDTDCDKSVPCSCSEVPISDDSLTTIQFPMECAPPSLLTAESICEKHSNFVIHSAQKNMTDSCSTHIPVSTSNSDQSPIDDTDNAIDKLQQTNQKTINDELSCPNRKALDQPSSPQMPFLGDAPYQPKDTRLLVNPNAKNGRPFQRSWFENEDWKSWLHYDVNRHAAFCFTCIRATQKNLISNKNAEPASVSIGYQNWAQAATKGRGFDKHCNSESHKEAHFGLHFANEQSEDIGEQLSSLIHEEKSENRQALLKILSNIRFLGRQSLPLRGTGKGENSNFTQLYLLREEDFPILKKWRTENKTNKYVHSTIQDSMMKVMALKILREIAANIRDSDFYAMMCDEATDVANTSQLVVCLRWVDEDLIAHDEYIGLKDMSDTSAQAIVKELKDVLLRMNLSIRKCRGQNYDGCSTMTGSKSGVVVQIKKEEKRALYSHCYGHLLNLAVGDAMKGSKVLKDTIDTTFELTKLVKKSPKRNAKLISLQTIVDEDATSDDDISVLIKAPTITLFCPTRWTVRGKCLSSVIENFDELQDTTDTDMKARIRGVSSHTKEFAYCFGLHLTYTILRNSYNLSKTLKATQMSSVEAQSIARATVKTLQSMRTDDQFDLFYKKVNQFAQAHDISSPSLPRRRKVPKKIQSYFGAAEHHPKSAEEDYRQKYFEAFDLIINCIKARFDQSDYAMYASCEQVLLKACHEEDFASEMRSVIDFYGDDFQEDVLETHLKILPFVLRDCKSVSNFHELLTKLKALSKSEKQLISQVILLVKLILVMPATNAVSERSFSATRRLLTYLRSTMKQNRLNHTMLLHIRKEKVDDLNMLEVANEFVEDSEHRIRLFGRFTNIDLRRKGVPVRSRGIQTDL